LYSRAYFLSTISQATKPRRMPHSRLLKELRVVLVNAVLGVSVQVINDTHQYAGHFRITLDGFVRHPMD
jgi:hypothetical protein